MGLSRDPVKAAKQKANLVPGAGKWPPGATPHLKAGLRSRRPPPIVLDPIIEEIKQAIAADLPVKDIDGGVPGADRFTVELAAIALLRVRRCCAFLALHGDADDRGNLRPEFETLGKAVEQAGQMLDRLGCSPSSRAKLGLDVGGDAEDPTVRWVRTATREELEQYLQGIDPGLVPKPRR